MTLRDLKNADRVCEMLGEEKVLLHLLIPISLRTYTPLHYKIPYTHSISCLFCTKHIAGKPCLPTWISWVTGKEERKTESPRDGPSSQRGSADKDTGCGRSRQRTIGKQDFPPCCSFPLAAAPIFHRPCHDHALGSNNRSRDLYCTGWKSPFQLLVRNSPSHCPPLRLHQRT